MVYINAACRSSVGRQRGRGQGQKKPRQAWGLVLAVVALCQNPLLVVCSSYCSFKYCSQVLLLWPTYNFILPTVENVLSRYFWILFQLDFFLLLSPKIKIMCKKKGGEGLVDCRITAALLIFLTTHIHIKVPRKWSDQSGTALILRLSLNHVRTTGKIRAEKRGCLNAMVKDKWEPSYPMPGMSFHQLCSQVFWNFKLKYPLRIKY